MTNVGFLGTGLLGSAMVENMLRRGERVTVWNRTASKAEALSQMGATVAGSVSDAVADASRVHMVLSDDDAVDAVLAAALPRLPAGAVVIDHTTVSPAGTIARYARMRDAGVRFLHAPVFMSPDMARASQGLMLTSGPDALVEMSQPSLAPMASEVWHLGDDPGRAAAYKLFGNSMIFVITAGLADVFAMARHLGLPSADALAVFSKFAVGNVLKGRGEKMSRGDFSASFEMTMARKDLRLMLEAAGDERLVVLPAIARRMDRAIANGHGREDLAAIMHADERRA
jgi:3-hydroxyisobutyrate dehydrogenase-like beta-hydroxyacid dehydrogenase